MKIGLISDTHIPEATPELLMAGRGELYLGFLLDPLYGVHWNNLVTPIHVELVGPTSVVFEPATFDGQQVGADADADPREFLIDFKGRSDEPLKVTVNYFACDDAETFCVPVTQDFDVSLQPLNNGSSRPGIFLTRKMIPRACLPAVFARYTRPATAGSGLAPVTA